MGGAISYLSCPACHEDNWNSQGCMTCGLEFWPPSSAYQAASPVPLAERVADLRALYTAGELDLRLSPVEERFWDANARLPDEERIAGLVPQYPALRYFLDFAVPRARFGIELDGHATHSSTAAIARDRQRQRALELAGWRVVRFGGAEVYHDARGCVQQALALLERAGR